MPQALAWNNGYGPIPAGFRLVVPDGYSVLVGKNDAGKTALLQWLFMRLYEANPNEFLNSACLILTDRFYVSSNMRTQETLQAYNSALVNNFRTNPKPFHIPSGPPATELFAALTQRTSMTRQNLRLNDLLGRVGFPPLEIVSLQEATLDTIGIHTHGAGIRCLLPILAALTSDDVKYVLIDEPELSLEARAQKVVKQLLVESSEAGKTVIVATQSHLFLNRKPTDLSNNLQVLGDSTTRFFVRATQSSEELLDLTYNLLGNSLEDLFFPANFLIVEGASDQRIAERVSHLLGNESTALKVVAANGIDNVEPSYAAMVNTLVPLIASASPYAKRVVVLLDRPTDEKSQIVVNCRKLLGDRCFVLDAQSLEEYLPEELYKRAGRSKNADLLSLKDLKIEAKLTSDGKRKLWSLKKDISDRLANELTPADSALIPQIFEAVKRGTRQ